MKPAGYFLDINILSHIIKNMKSSVANKLRKIGNDKIFTSIIVASELQFGIKKEASSKLTQRVEKLLALIKILDFIPHADIHYVEIRNFLQKQKNQSDQMIYSLPLRHWLKI